MKKTLLLQRRGGALVPADPWAEEDLWAIPEGKQIEVSWTEDRSVKENRFFHAGIALAFDNLDDDKRAHYGSPRKLKNAFLVALGFAEPVYHIGSEVFHMEADSTAFDRMDEAEFNSMFNRAIIFAENWLGYNPWQAWKIKKQMEKQNDWRRNYRPGDED